MDLEKVINLSGIVIILVVIGFFGVIIYDVNQTKKSERFYCGKVTNIFYTEAGYKVSAKPRIVFYCNELKRNINVETTWNTYSNKKVGDQVCFKLNKYEIIR